MRSDAHYTAFRFWLTESLWTQQSLHGETALFHTDENTLGTHLPFLESPTTVPGTNDGDHTYE